MFNKETDYSIEKITSDTESRRKRGLVYFLFAYMFTFGVTSSIENTSNWFISFIDTVFLPVLIACALSWVATDLHAKGKMLNIEWGVGMFLLSPIVLPYYYYSSRGFKNGSMLLAKTVGVLFISILLSTFGAICYEAAKQT